MKTIISLILLSFPLLNYAQTYVGKVVNKMNEPIPYVNIHCKTSDGKILGGIANEDGKFTIVIATVTVNDSITFSSIGYFPEYIPLNNLKKNIENVIILKENINTLKEVVVTPYKNKLITKSLGTLKNYSDAGTYLGFGQIGAEVALYLDNKENYTGILKNVKVRLTRENQSTLPVRIHVYSNKPGLNIPQEELLPEAVFARAQKKNSTYIIADIERFRIPIPKEGIFIGIEFLPIGELIIDFTKRKSSNEVPDSLKEKYVVVQRGHVKNKSVSDTWIKVDYHKKLEKGKWYNDKEVGYSPNVGLTNVIMGADIIINK